jgi:hypothetical protein
MMNELDKKNKLTQSAYISGRNAIMKRLGPGASNEEVLSVVQLMVHLLLTDNYTLPAAIALHNAKVFDDELKVLIQESQKDVKSSTCGLLS